MTTLPPLRGEHARRAFAEARGAAGDDEDLACDVHGLLLLRELLAMLQAAAARVAVSGAVA